MRFFSAATVLAAAPLALAFTPEDMLAAPRRSDFSPNPSGELAVFSETTYDWDEHAASTVFKMMDISSGDITTLTKDENVSELAWVGPTDTSILYINASNADVAGGVTMYMTDAKSFSDATLVASLPAPYANLKAKQTDSGDINFLVTCLAYKNGTAYNEELAATPLSTARIYNDIFVRHWDTWLTPERYALFSGSLKSSNSSGGYGNSSSSYTFGGEMTNLLEKLDYTITRPEVPVQPYGDSGDYDLSPDGSTVAFLTKAPELTKANYTSSYIYLVPFDGSSAPVSINTPEKAPGKARGASSSPRWSPDGKSLAYLQMDNRVYESDKNKIYIASFGSGYTNSTKITGLATDWDRSPDILVWSSSGKSVLVGAPDLGNEKVFPVPLSASSDYKPSNITKGGKTGSVASFYSLPDTTILVSDSSIYSSRGVYSVSEKGTDTKKLFAANEVDELLSGLGPEDIDQFYYKGNFSDVQAWITYPEGFDKSKKYPLAFIVHGGPQGGWYNSWSTRWNFKVWADQGYVAVMPNPTGSSGYGQYFQDMIQNNWGSYPYDDLVKCWETLASDKFPYIDTDNGIEAGASYGGFMTNWIQGHDLGRKFKALVTHDGITSTLDNYASEELWFIQHDFNGTLWDNRDNYEKWDPLAHASEFATPHYVVHSSMDFRLPESEGIELFNVLQERGVPSRFLNFPDENHWVQNRENSLVWHTEIFNWINHYSGLENKQAIDTSGYVGSG